MSNFMKGKFIEGLENIGEIIADKVMQKLNIDNNNSLVKTLITTLIGVSIYIILMLPVFIPLIKSLYFSN